MSTRHSEDSDLIQPILKEFSLWTRGVVYAYRYLDTCPCTHLFQSSLPGWGKIIFAAHVCTMFPRRGGSWCHSCLLSCELYHCHDGLDICIISVSNGGPWEFLLLAAEEDAPLMLVCSLTFEPLKTGRSCIKMPVIPKWLKELHHFWVLTAFGKSSCCHLSVCADTSNSSRWGLEHHFLLNEKQEAPAVHI